MTQKLVGDGCQKCNPTLVIDMLELHVQDLEHENTQLQERLTAYDKWLSEGVYYTTAEAFELHDGYNSKIAQLQAENLKLREALDKLSTYAYGLLPPPYVKEALASTPAQSLQDHDDEVIERCLNCYSPDDTYQDWADKIRKLKGKQK